MAYRPDAANLILTAAERARQLGHSYVGTVHLLLALTDLDSWEGKLLRCMGATPQLLQDLTVLHYGQGHRGLPLQQGLSTDALQVLSDAAGEACGGGEREICPEHILLALTRREEHTAAHLLRLCGVEPQQLFSRAVEYRMHGYRETVKRTREGFTTKLLEQFSEDLVAKAATMDPVIGREREIEVVIGILSRKNKNSPVAAALDFLQRKRQNEQVPENPARQNNEAEGFRHIASTIYSDTLLKWLCQTAFL